MKTVIRENTWLNRKIEGFPEFNIDFGWGNGYALIPIGHKFHGKDYDYINKFINIHGGLTYGELITEETIKFYNLDKEDIGTWCVGFDTCHLDDTLMMWPKERVQEEANNLAEQLEEYSYKFNEN
jgi:hypothetical protein